MTNIVTYNHIYVMAAFVLGALIAYVSNRKLHLLILQFLASRMTYGIWRSFKLGTPKILKEAETYQKIMQSIQSHSLTKREYNNFVSKYVQAIVNGKAIDPLHYLILVIKHFLLLVAPIVFFLPVWWAYLLGVAMSVAYFFPYGKEYRNEASKPYISRVLIEGLVNYWNETHTQATQPKNKQLTFRWLSASASKHRSWRIIRRTYFVAIVLVGIMLVLSSYVATNNPEYELSLINIATYVIVAPLFAFAAYGVLLFVYVILRNFIATLFFID